MRFLKSIKKIKSAIPARYLKSKRNSLNLRQKHLLEGEQNALEKIELAEERLSEASNDLDATIRNKKVLIARHGKRTYDNLIQKQIRELHDAEEHHATWKSVLRAHSSEIPKTMVERKHVRAIANLLALKPRNALKRRTKANILRQKTMVKQM
jgi:hypothetical protein